MLSDTTIKRINALGDISKQGKRVNGLFRLMENPVLWKTAYAKIYSNKGALTQGVNKNTLDGFSEERVINIIKLLKAKKFKFRPARRSYILKANGKMRPLGIPTGDDKLVQAVMKELLERIYEPIFTEKSHGFRPNRSCHTALQQVRAGWTSTKWLIEADIKSYFDSINHELLIEMLSRKIDDDRFINLIRCMLKAGYLENWTFHNTYSGTPQGGVISPILANIYLHELDCKVEAMIAEFNSGKKRKDNPEYKALSWKISQLYKKFDEIKTGAKPETLKAMGLDIKALKAERAKLPAGDPKDSSYRRLFYCRYADDFILGIIGTKDDAVQVLKEIKVYVESELKLELAEEKTGIKHASDGTRFLGYDVRSYTGQRIKKVVRSGRRTTSKTTSERMQLFVPREKIMKFCKTKGYGDYVNWIYTPRTYLIDRSIPEIITIYNAEIRGFMNFYAMANSPKRVLGKLHGMWWGSLIKTLAGKQKTSMRKIVKGLKQSDGSYVYTDNSGKKVRQFRLHRLKTDFIPEPMVFASVDVQFDHRTIFAATTELIARMDANKCEYCGKQNGYFEVHHIRKLVDLAKEPSLWAKMMARMQRKTFVLCVECHHQLHNGNLPSWKRGIYKVNLESRIR